MEISRRLFVKILTAIVGILGFQDYLTAQVNKTLATLVARFFAPNIFFHSYFIENSRTATIRAAAQISTELENYVCDGFSTAQSFILRHLLLQQKSSFQLGSKQTNLSWKVDSTGLSENLNLIGHNNQNNFLCECRPILCYTSRDESKQLGNGRIDAIRLLEQR